MRNDINYQIVECTNTSFLKFYQEHAGISLHKSLVAQEGLPMGCLAYNSLNEVVGSVFMVNESMRRQMGEEGVNNSSPWIVALLVDPKMRNQKIGFGLMESIANYAASIGFSDINFNTETAAGYYEKYFNVKKMSLEMIFIKDTGKHIPSVFFSMPSQNFIKNHTKKPHFL